MRSRRDDEAHNAGDQKRDAPSEDLPQPAAHQEPEQDAQTRTEREDRHRGAAAIDRKEVGDHRMRWRIGSCLADADADTRKKKLPVARCHAAQRRHQAEQRDGHGQDAGTVEPIREPAERNPEDRIEHCEREPVQEPELRVGERRDRA